MFLVLYSPPRLPNNPFFFRVTLPHLNNLQSLFLHLRIPEQFPHPHLPSKAATPSTSANSRGTPLRLHCSGHCFLWTSGGRHRFLRTVRQGGSPLRKKNGNPPPPLPIFPEAGTATPSDLNKRRGTPLGSRAVTCGSRGVLAGTTLFPARIR